MKTTSLLITAAVSLLAGAVTSHAAPAHARAKAARVGEIHCNETMPRTERPSATTPTAGETSLFRSRAELDMVNPG